MPADIVLNDNSVDVLGGTFRALEGGGDGKLWLRAALQKATDHAADGAVTFAVGNRLHSTATMHVVGQDGDTRVSSTAIRTGSVLGRQSVISRLGEFEQAVADEVTVGNVQRFSEETKPGILNVKTAGGENSIVLDGASGDITLNAIGSLVAKINDLQRQIDELRA